MKLCRLALLLILIKCLTSSQIIYEFKRNFELKETMTEEEIYLKLSYNDIYTNIKIGTPEKELKVGISFKEKALVLLGSNIKDREVFNEKGSSSYKPISSIYFYESQISAGNKSEEYLNLNTINKKLKINFILATQIEKESLISNSYEPIYFSGYLGLAINSLFQQDYPESLPIFLYENYKDEFNSAFSIKFNIKEPGNYNGKLIMNGYPHENDKDNYHIEQYKTTRIQSIDNLNDWCFSIDNTYYGNTPVIQNNYIIFRIEIGIIIAPVNFMKHLKANYFDKYNDKCKYNTLKLMSEDYNYYVCNNDIDIKTFQDIKFELKANDFNFTLTYKDLFYEYNKKYYFLIASGSSSLQHFILGPVLMKKYDFVFDKFKSNIGFYDFSIIVDEKNHFIIYIIIIAVLVFLIILVLIYLIWKYFNKPRNSRKNELNDDYNYISGINAEEKEEVK